MENILIDTDIVIDYLRARDKASTHLIHLLKQEQVEISVSSVTEFELYLGARSNRHVKDLEMLFNEVDVLPFDFGCGKIAAGIWNDLLRKHQHAEIKDIFIASIAIHNDIQLCTLNLKHFSAIPGIKIWKDLPFSFES